MKIVFVTDTLSSGGSERVLSTLANSLCKTYEVSIVCLRNRIACNQYKSIWCKRTNYRSHKRMLRRRCKLDRTSIFISIGK